MDEICVFDRPLSSVKTAELKDNGEPNTIPEFAKSVLAPIILGILPILVQVVLIVNKKKKGRL